MPVKQIVEIVSDAARQQAETFELLRTAQPVFQLMAFAPHLRLSQLAPNRRNQPAESMFQHVVVSASLHGLYGGFFADGGRDDQEGQVGGALLGERQSLGHGEVGHGKIGKHQIPRTFVQCAQHAFGVIHTAEMGVEAAAFELHDDQIGVLFGILHDQNV